MTFRKLLGIDLVNYGMHENNFLPNWLQCNQSNGVIFLEGIPEEKDVEDLIIRIYNAKFYII